MAVVWQNDRRVQLDELAQEMYKRASSATSTLRRRALPFRWFSDRHLPPGSWPRAPPIANICQQLFQAPGGAAGGTERQAARLGSRRGIDFGADH